MRKINSTKTGTPSGFKTRTVAETPNNGKGKRNIATLRLVVE